MRTLRSLLRPAAAILVAAAAVGRASAQETERPSGFEFGFDPSIVVTYPLGTLTTIDGLPPCCSGYEAASNVNLGASLWGTFVFTQRPVDSGLFIRGLRITAGYDNLSSTFETTRAAEALDTLSGEYVRVDSRQTAELDMQYLRGAVALETALGGGLLLRVGPTIDLPISGTSRERESLESEDVTFPDGSTERITREGNGEIDDMTMRFGFDATLAYRLPLGRRFFFEPHLGVDLGLAQISPDWSPLVVRGGITLGMIGMKRTAEPTPVAVADAPVPTVDPPKPPAEPVTIERFEPVMNVRASLPNDSLTVRMEIVERYVPLLPALFFDLNRWEIAGNYTMLAREDAAGFSEEMIRPDASSAHRNSLNILGSRLRLDPRATVTLTGSTSSDEQAREDLAARRAEEVANYLKNVWGIPRSRIKVRAQANPTIPSNEEHEEGREENRRLEIMSASGEVARPVLLRVMEPALDQERITFNTGVTSTRAIRFWQLDMNNRAGRMVDRIVGEGHPPERIAWEIGDAALKALTATDNLLYDLVVFDSLGNSSRSRQGIVRLGIDSTVSVTTSEAVPVDAAEFQLVTFDFDRAELTEQGGEELKEIIRRVGPESVVEVTGYTDRMGDPERNQQLATARAEAVAGKLPRAASIVTRGAPPSEAPYPGDTPHDRFLSRTVRVVVRHPK